jgi:predicted ATP-binding protein involved in virulence
MLLLLMNKPLILETVRSWADNRFTSAVGQHEVSERSTPPPFVDVRAGLPDTPPDVSGVFFGLQAESDKSLQIWISADGLGNAYTFMDTNEGESHPQPFSMPASPEGLKDKLSEMADRFMRTMIFEPALDEWVAEVGGSYEFQEIDFAGEAALTDVRDKSWSFFRYQWPGSEEVEVVAGFDGSGNAATFSDLLTDLSGFYDFEEKVSGLANAQQFRTWLDKAVGRPAAMSIKKIAVENLFGHLSYVIPLKTESSATIIHAPNGCGKTTIFHLVLSLLKGRFGELCQVCFDALILEFDGGRRLVVKQVRQQVDPEVADAEERRRRRSSYRHNTSSSNEAAQSGLKILAVELLEIDGRVLNQDEIPVERSGSRSRIQSRNAALRIARRTPHLRGDRQGILDSSTGEFLSFDEVLDRYATPGAGEAKEWLSKLLARNEAHLVRTKRLDAEVILDRDSLREELEIIPAAVQHAKEVAGIIKTKLRDFSNVSQKLDGDFLNELIGSEQLETRAHKDLQDDLSEVAQKYGRVAEAGILVGSSGNNIPQLPDHAADDPTITKALGLYVENQLQKLRVFDEILQKIETLKSLVNERFQMKRLEVSSEMGYSVVSKHDGSLIPLDRLSSGEQHQLVLFHSLIFGMRPGALIMIDEPEISLHVAWQQVFLRDLERIAKDTGAHFLIATHSPQIIDDNWDLTVGLAEQISDNPLASGKESGESMAQ